MRREKIIFIYLLLIPLAFYLYSTEFSQYADAARTSLTGQTTTSYWPGADGIEGGWETAKPGPTGQFLPSTLEMVRTGQSNYVTVASDPSRNGEWYLIPEISYINTKGDKYTLKNVKAYVHDTGSAFKNRPDKFDIAVDRGTGFSGDTLDKLQSTNGVGFQGQKIVYLPSGGKSVTTTTSISQGPAQTPSSPTNTTPTQAIPTYTPTPVAKYPSSSGGFLWDSRDRYCHKHTGSASPGELKTAMTCNGGFKCQQVGGKHPYYYSIFISDCGPKNANCDSAAIIGGGGYCPPKEANPQDGPMAGCLNYKCKNKPNAIWDMGSKKCGCG